MSNKLENRVWFTTTIIFMLAFFTCMYLYGVSESRVKELETENKELREKVKEIKIPKPTLRMYNQKCNCSCNESK